ncbi:MAG: transcription antitermination factor NusB [Pirellula sp.]|jgi:N utilization substance protein B|nr:transcription antitermination factor NusB [Pirellula sp.]
MTTRRRAREIVLQVLYEEDLHPLREDAVADEFLARRLLHSSSLVEFARQLWHGVREHRAELDERIEKHSANWSLKRMATIDRNVLRMAAYEILYAGVPGRVAINEAIEIARRYGSLNSGQFVNGILDRVLKDNPEPAPAGQSESDVLS